MKAIDYAGRAVGAAAGAAVSILWASALWLPSSGSALTGLSFVVALLMAMIALIAAIAAVRGHAVVLIVAFVASFFPVGVTLAGTDHWLSWAGRLNLCYLVAGVLIAVGRRGMRTRSRRGIPAKAEGRPASGEPREAEVE